MAKYSNDLKLKGVQYYSNNYVSFKVVADKFNIPSWTIVKKWVRKYEEHGLKGLVKNKVSSYSGEFKQNVQNICIITIYLVKKQHMNNKCIIV